MDQPWRDYEREVEEVLSALRAEKAQAGPQSSSDFSEVVIPAAPTVRELARTREMLAQIEPIVLDLRRKLEERTQQLEAELRRQSELKDLIVKQTGDIRRLESETEQTVRQAEMGRGSLQNLSDKLRDAQKSAEGLRAALEQEKERSLERTAELERSAQRVAQLEAVIAEKDRSLNELQLRQNLIARNFTDQAAAREKKTLELERQLEDAKLELKQFEERIKVAELRQGRMAEEHSAALLELSQSQAAFARAGLELKGMAEQKERIHQLELERGEMKAELARAAEAQARAARAEEEARQFQARLNERAAAEERALEDERRRLSERARQAIEESDRAREAEAKAAARQSQEQSVLLALKGEWQKEAAQALAKAHLIEQECLAREAELRRQMQAEAEKAAAYEKDLQTAFAAGAERLREAVKLAMEDAQKERASAAAALREGRLRQSEELDRSEAEKLRLKNEMEAERRKLWGEVETEKAKTEIAAREALEADRRRLSLAFEEKMRLAAEQARRQAEAQAERQKISSDTQWNIKKD